MNHPSHRFMPAEINGRMAIVFALRESEWPNSDHIERCAALVKERVGDTGGVMPDHGRICHELIAMAKEGVIVQHGDTWFCLGQPKAPLAPRPGQAPAANPCKPS